MDWLSNVAVFVAAWGGAGAFADFLLGKAGQKSVRDTLEAWWVMLSDVRLATSTAREAGVAALLLERMFGTFWSSGAPHPSTSCWPGCWHATTPTRRDAA